MSDVLLDIKTSGFHSLRLPERIKALNDVTFEMHEGDVPWASWVEWKR